MEKIVIEKSKNTWQEEGQGIFDKVHLVSPLGDGETTFCSIAYPEEVTYFTSRKVNCKECLRAIKQLKICLKEYDKSNRY